ncbi:MAG: hypothetical protein AAFV86_18190, partial [Pseudomonadota bacterium]
GGLIATTADITDAAFMAGEDRFDIPGSPDAAVVNEGRITFGEAGLVGLVGPQARNAGVIAGRLGTVVVAGAETFAIDPAGDGILALPVGEGAAVLAENTGTIANEGGRVLMDAAAAEAALARVLADGEIAASSVSASEGRITLSGGEVVVGGSLDVSGVGGAAGGTVIASGDTVHLTETARVEASGSTGAAGGTVRIGGDVQGRGPVPSARRTLVEEGATIAADGAGSGDGGSVVVWSDEATGFAGAISVRGGDAGGDGGFAEVSGGFLAFEGTVDLGAAAGTAGTLLLDPDTINVDTGGDAVAGDVLEGDLPAIATLDPASIAAVDGALLLQASSTVSVLAPIDNTGLTRPDGTPQSLDLTLQAGQAVNISAPVTLNGSLTADTTNSFGFEGGAGVLVSADVDVSGTVRLAVDSLNDGVEIGPGVTVSAGTLEVDLGSDPFGVFFLNNNSVVEVDTDLVLPDTEIDGTVTFRLGGSLGQTADTGLFETEVGLLVVEGAPGTTVDLTEVANTFSGFSMTGGTSADVAAPGGAGAGNFELGPVDITGAFDLAVPAVDVLADVSAGDITMVADAITLDPDVTVSGAAIGLTTQALTLDAGASIVATGALTTEIANVLSFGTGATVDAAGGFTFSNDGPIGDVSIGDDVFLGAGAGGGIIEAAVLDIGSTVTIDVSGDLTVVADTGDGGPGDITAGDDVALLAGGTVDVDAAALTAGTGLELRGADVVLALTSGLFPGDGSVIESAGDLALPTVRLSAGAASIGSTGGSITQQAGTSIGPEGRGGATPVSFAFSAPAGTVTLANAGNNFASASIAATAFDVVHTVIGSGASALSLTRLVATDATGASSIVTDTIIAFPFDAMATQPQVDVAGDLTLSAPSAELGTVSLAGGDGGAVEVDGTLDFDADFGTLLVLDGASITTGGTLVLPQVDLSGLATLTVRDGDLVQGVGDPILPATFDGALPGRVHAVAETGSILLSASGNGFASVAASGTDIDIYQSESASGGLALTLEAVDAAGYAYVYAAGDIEVTGPAPDDLPFAPDPEGQVSADGVLTLLGDEVRVTDAELRGGGGVVFYVAGETLIITGSGSIVSNAGLTLDDTEVDGVLTLEVTGGAITQEPGTSLRAYDDGMGGFLPGELVIDAPGQDVTITNAGNTFSGAEVIDAATVTLSSSTTDSGAAAFALRDFATTGGLSLTVTGAAEISGTGTASGTGIAVAAGGITLADGASIATTAGAAVIDLQAGSDGLATGV